VGATDVAIATPMINHACGKCPARRLRERHPAEQGRSRVARGDAAAY
jgi:hypothetical protein